MRKKVVEQPGAKYADRAFVARSYRRFKSGRTAISQLFPKLASQLIQRKRLGQQFDRCLRRSGRRGAVAGHQHDRQVRPSLAGSAGEVQAAHVTWHDHVGKQCVRGQPFIKRRQCFAGLSNPAPHNQLVNSAPLQLGRTSINPVA